MKKSFKFLLFSLLFVVPSCGAANVKGPEIIDTKKDSRQFGQVFDTNDICLEFTNGTKREKYTYPDVEFTYDNDFTMFSEKGKVNMKLAKYNYKGTYEFNIKPRQSFSLLMIGNSFSDDTIEYMYDICFDLGIECEIVNLFVGGCSLDIHYLNFLKDNKVYEKRYYEDGQWKTITNVGIKETVESFDWDFISFQQASGQSGLVNSYSKLPYLIADINESLVDRNHTQYIFNMTWAYAQNSTHSDFSRYSNNQLVMYLNIIDAVNENVVSNKDIKTIIPNGTAIQNARTSYVGDNLNRDGYHLTYDLGRYIAGLMAVKTLTNCDLSELEFAPDGLSKLAKEVAIESVNNAFKSRFEITESMIKDGDEREELLKNYDILDIDFFEKGFYNSSLSGKHDSIIFDDSAMSKCFCTTNVITATNIPVGSVIYIKTGYKYRPEGWDENMNVNSMRPSIVTSSTFKVTQSWIDQYAFRAFNISNSGQNALTNGELQLISHGEIFTIFIPKK